MKALVIGGTGPTGPFIVEGLLERGYKVSILHRGTHEVPFSSEVEHLHGDPHFKDLLEELLGPRTYDLVVCTYGRLRHVAQVMEGRTPRLISIGGGKVFQAFVNASGPVGIPVPIPEDAPLALDPDLGMYYLVAVTEQEVMKLHLQGQCNVTHFRYPEVYGPRQLVPREWSIIKRILDGRKQLILPDGGSWLLSWGYAENMAHAVMLAVDKPEESRGQIYNCRDDRLITLRERIELISRVLGHEWEFVNVAGELARPSRAYAPAWYHAVMDTAKIKTELGYCDPVPVEEGIRRTAEYYLENHPETGGDTERHLRDPFDYVAEDRFIDEIKQASARILAIPFNRGETYHPYAHPKEKGMSRDQRGR